MCWRRLLDHPAQLGADGLAALFSTLRAQSSLGPLRLACRATRAFVDANTHCLDLRLHGTQPLRPGGWAALLARCGGAAEVRVRADPSGYCRQRKAAVREPGCMLGVAFGEFPTPATARVRTLEVDIHRGRYVESGGWTTAGAAAGGGGDGDVNGGGGGGRVWWNPATALYESASSGEADPGLNTRRRRPLPRPAAAAVAAAAAGAGGRPTVSSSKASHVQYTSLLAFPHLVHVALCGEWACPPEEPAARAVGAVLGSLPHLRSLRLGRFSAAMLQQLAAGAAGIDIDSSGGERGSGGCEGGGGGAGGGGGGGGGEGGSGRPSCGAMGAAARPVACLHLRELTLGEAEEDESAAAAEAAKREANPMDAALTAAAAAALAALGRLERLRLYGVAPGGAAMREVLMHGLSPNLERLEFCRSASSTSRSGRSDSGSGSGNVQWGRSGAAVNGAGGVAGCWLALLALPPPPPQQLAAASAAASSAAATTAGGASSLLRRCDCELDCPLADAGAAAGSITYAGLNVRQIRAVRVMVEAGAPPPPLTQPAIQPYGALRQLAGSAHHCRVDCVELRLMPPPSAAAAAGELAAAAAAAAAHAAATTEAIGQVAALLAAPRALHISAPLVASPGQILEPLLALDRGVAEAVRELVMTHAPALSPALVPQLMAALPGLEALVVGRGCRQLWHNSHCYELVAGLAVAAAATEATEAAAKVEAAAGGGAGSGGGHVGGTGSVPGMAATGAAVEGRRGVVRVVVTAPQVSAARVAELNERLVDMGVPVRLATRV